MRKMRSFSGLCIALIFTVFAVVAAPPAIAQDSTSTAEALQPLLDKARESGATVIVVEPGEKKAKPDTGNLQAVGVTSEKLRANAKRILLSAGSFFQNMDEAFEKAAPGQGRSWIFMGIVLGAIALAIGYFVGRMADNWGRNAFSHIYNPNPVKRSEKIGYLLFRAVMLLIMAIVASGTAAIIVLVIAGENQPLFVTAMMMVAAYAVIRLVRLIFLNLLAPDAPNHRVINMSDEDASGLYRSLISVYAFAVITLGTCMWMSLLGISKDTHTLAVMVSVVLATILVCGLCIRYRKAVGGAIIGNDDYYENAWWVRFLSRFWHVAAVFYFAAACAVTVVRQILALPAANGLVGVPVTALVVGLALYGILLLIIDKTYTDRIAIAPDESDTVEDLERQIEAQTPVFKSLAESAAGILSAFVGLLMIASVWGVKIFDPNSIMMDFLSAGLILFMAYIAYEAVKAWIDREIAKEEPAPDDEHGGESEMGTGSSRIATLLPIFRNFLLITIVVLAAMMILAELGVNIGPLFASAGVIGLAIGFGAQTLIRDIFSGAFFLMDDAFRKGEYIDIGSVKGTVEKISIRSFQLRHHKGPLNTVPFGEIRHLTNFSRDWVLMKLQLRVTYDTDVEKVRKLIKKLGQELLEHPELGSAFLQPLKSQGVYSMEDSAMIIRVKFMTKPGDQFLIRKLVYERIRELFEENDIKFAHKEVTVRIADEDIDESGPTERQKKAATGAVRSAIDEEGAAGGKPSDAM